MSRSCPRCDSGRLHRHGFFERTYFDAQGVHETVSVLRVRCSSCRQSFSLLYDFLIPYRRYSIVAFEASVLAYLAAFCSYSEALWSSTEAETKMVYSTLFRLVGSMTQQVRTAQQQLQTALLEADIEIGRASCRERVC